MNKKMIFVTILLTTLLWNANSVLSNEEHDDDMNMEEGVDQCTTPTAEITITADLTGLAYTAQEYHVEKNTCYELIFENPSAIEHDVNIDEVHGDDGIESVHLHLANSNDENGVKTIHVQTPNVDTEFAIYCSVLGHRASGMEAIFHVGEGTPADEEGFLPVNMLSTVFGFALLSLIVKFKRN